MSAPDEAPEVLETEVTPAMIEAGVEALSRFFGWDLDDPEKIVVSVFWAMWERAPLYTADPSE
jgi:hypothetical protein